MKKLLSILGSIAMVGTASATVVACGKTGETKVETEDYKAILTKKIDEIKESKTKIETEQQKDWGPIASKVIEPFNLIISDAEAAVEAEGLTEEVANGHISKLDKGFETFQLGIPKSIISEVINKQGDIQNLFSKSWTHANFFGEDDESYQKVIGFFKESVQNAAQTAGYEGEELTTLGNAVSEWAKKNLALVYINAGPDGKQQIKYTYENVDSKATLEKLFLDQVKADFKFTDDTEINKPEFWEKNPLLSLGIKFSKDKLNQDIKDFWTFTFAENTPFNEKSQKKLQAIIDDRDKVERNENGQVVFKLPKRNEKKGLTGTMDRELRKLFKGKFFIPSLYSGISTAWVGLPNDKQVEEGIDWDSKPNQEIGFKKNGADLFKITLSYRIEWIK